RDTSRKQGQPPMEEVISAQLKQRGARVKTVELTPQAPLDDIRHIPQQGNDYDYVFFNLFTVPNWGIGTLIPNKNAVRMFMFGLLSIKTPVIITAFGDPYSFYYCPAAPVFLCTFDESRAAQQAAVRAWLGETPITGKMPVSLPGFFNKGDGLQL
ncbi:MAG TPA: hypothetical protein VKS21_02450, partial [Spirochaetota bacterium]|nr:hypothetical protein [Spirochaetota bacterium]